MSYFVQLKNGKNAKENSSLGSTLLVNVDNEA